MVKALSTAVLRQCNCLSVCLSHAEWLKNGAFMAMVTAGNPMLQVEPLFSIAVAVKPPEVLETAMKPSQAPLQKQSLCGCTVHRRYAISAVVVSLCAMEVVSDTDVCV